jgi:type I restriction enzyme S subunit
MAEQTTIDLTSSQMSELKGLLAQYLPNTQVWAYGSRVNWNARANSDLDMVAFTGATQQENVSLLREAFEESNLPFSVDFFVWDTVPEQFKANIKKEYIELQSVEDKKERVGSEWPKRLLGDLIELKRGYDLPKIDRQEGDVPIISSSGISDVHSVFKVSGPGVVTGRYGTIGKVFYTDIDFWPLNTTLYVRNFKGNDPKFIYYFLKTIPYQQYSDKAAVPGVNRNHLHMAEIKAPNDIAEQKCIAHVLGTLDNKIELNRQTNQTLEQMAQALFKSWFVDFDPVIDNALAAGNSIPDDLQERAQHRKQQLAKPDHQPLPDDVLQLFPSEFEETEELGWVPKGWKVEPVGSVIENVGGGTPKTKEDTYWIGGIHAFCTPKDMSGLSSKVLLETERHLTEAGVTKISSGILPIGTVLMSSRAPIGYLAITETPVSINQGIIALKENSKYGCEYLLCWAEANMEDVVSRANGSTFLEISKKNFREIPFLKPDEIVLSLFSDMAGGYFKRITSLQQQINQLTKLRDTLLPKLISGELRLPESMLDSQTNPPMDEVS